MKYIVWGFFSVSRPIPVSDQLFKDLFEDYNSDVMPMFGKYDLDKIRSDNLGNWTQHAVKVEINLSLRQIVSVVNLFLLPFGVFDRIYIKIIHQRVPVQSKFKITLLLQWLLQ